MFATEECIEIVILSGKEGHSQRDVAAEFDRTNPHRQSPPITHSTVGRLSSILLKRIWFLPFCNLSDRLQLCFDVNGNHIATIL